MARKEIPHKVQLSDLKGKYQLTMSLILVYTCSMFYIALELPITMISLMLKVYLAQPYGHKHTAIHLVYYCIVFGILPHNCTLGVIIHTHTQSIRSSFISAFSTLPLHHYTDRANSQVRVMLQLIAVAAVSLNLWDIQIANLCLKLPLLSYCMLVCSVPKSSTGCREPATLKSNAL